MFSFFTRFWAVLTVIFLALAFVVLTGGSAKATGGPTIVSDPPPSRVEVTEVKDIMCNIQKINIFVTETLYGWEEVDGEWVEAAPVIINEGIYHRDTTPEECPPEEETPVVVVPPIDEPVEETTPTPTPVDVPAPEPVRTDIPVTAPVVTPEPVPVIVIEETTPTVPSTPTMELAETGTKQQNAVAMSILLFTTAGLITLLGIFLMRRAKRYSSETE